MIDITAIKNIDPEIIFDALHIPYKSRGRGYIFRCVWREDKEPSGWCEYGNDAWVWVDYATGEGGSWIDLLMKIENCDIKEAIYRLSELDFKCNTSVSIRENRCNTGCDVEIVKVFKAKHSDVIKNFLSDWGITLIPEWLKAIKFRLNQKFLFGFGVENIKGGWHVRLCLNNPVVKEYCLLVNAPAILGEYDSNQVVVIEGMKDALFVWQWLCSERISAVILSLNGVGNWRKAVNIINKNFSSVILALDNDEAGLKTEEKLVNNLKIPLYKMYYKGKDPAEAKNHFIIKPLEVKNENGKRKTFRRTVQ